MAVDRQKGDPELARFGLDTFLGDIWTVRADGSDARQVSTSPRFEFRSDWG